MKTHPVKTISLLLMIPALALAQGPRGERPGGPPQDASRRAPLHLRLSDPVEAEKLGLTPEQTTAVQNILEADRETLERLRERQRLAQRNLADTIRRDGATEADVVAAVEKAAAISLDIRKIEVLQRFRIRQVAGDDLVDRYENRQRERRDQQVERPGRPDRSPGGPRPRD
ncbi:MAG TPA: hypothetical protein PKE55_01560 [Kiritimatiellia bacterium]|nr:hypothetical protein [Kiritimatiellia bacterium]